MKTKETIEISSLIKMITLEANVQYARYKSEVESPLSSIVDSGDALGPLVLKVKVSLFRIVLSGSAYYSRFRPGDRVELRVQRQNTDFSDNLIRDWQVIAVGYPSPGRIEVVIQGEKPLELDSKTEVFLFKNNSYSFSQTLIAKIKEVAFSNDPILLGSGSFHLKTDDEKFHELYENLNTVQKNAIDFLVSNNLNGAVQGPPGTGKTQILRALVTLAIKSNMKVCMASFTHAAVDNLISRMIVGNLVDDWVRIGEPNRIDVDGYLQNIDGHSYISPNFSDEINESRLFGCTLHKLAHNFKAAPKFDLLVLDEAGQVPIYFWPLIQRITKRVILVGDQFQLPPVFSANHAGLPFDNLFSSVIDDDTPMLETQYRMRREIQAWSSEKFYKGKLVPHSSVEDRDFFEGNRAFFTDKFVAPKRFDSTDKGRTSKAEANFIAEKIEQLVRDKIDLERIGVICPYRAQAGTVNATLQNRLGVDVASKILVDTVERFQGREKEAIFLSFGISNPSDADLKFLNDSRRLNVSVTRAKSRFYCLFDTELWNRTNNLKFDNINEFLRWTTFGKTNIKRAASS